MKTTAIIVTYNKKEELKESLKAIFSLNDGIYKVVVINNNSSDGTDEYLKSIDDDRLIYKNLDVNLGGAGGFSKGLETAYEQTDSDYFWIMDDDATAHPNALKSLVDTAKKLNNEFGFLSSNVIYEDGNGGNCPETITGNWNVDLYTKGLIRVSSSTFVSLFIRRVTVKELGLPIGEMFIWGDDNEYTTRISTRTPYGSYFVMDSVITHRSKSFSTDIRNCPINFLVRYKYLFRNLIYMDLHDLTIKDFLVRLLKNLYLATKLLFRSKNHRFKRSLTVVSGTINGLFFSPKVKFPKENNN